MSPLVIPGPRLAKLIPRLASDHDGEVVSTARAIGRTLAGAGCDFHDLARALETVDPTPAGSNWEPSTFSDVARWLREHDKGRLAQHERDFVVSIAARLVCGGEPTERQAAWLRRLYAKLGGAA